VVAPLGVGRLVSSLPRGTLCVPLATSGSQLPEINWWVFFLPGFPAASQVPVESLWKAAVKVFLAIVAYEPAASHVCIFSVSLEPNYAFIVGISVE